MSSKTFLHVNYARDNADVAKHYGAEDEVLLRAHYENYGRQEMRGVDISLHMRIEAVVCCDTGHILLSGWADRRHIRTLDLTIDVGYERNAFGQVDGAWYMRPDVAAVTGDSELPSGFLLLLKLDDVTPHSSLGVQVNGKLLFQSGNTRWLSVAPFMNQALAAAAVLSDLPIGQSLACAKALHGPFRDVWHAYLEKLTFALAFETKQRDPAQVSIIITIYKRADMLLPQLEALAPLLRGTATEVIIVCNELVGAEAIVERLRGFCQIWDIPLRLYLCSGNSGFSRANNFGADVARGQSLVFMNPDVFAPEHKAHQPGVLNFLQTEPGNALHGAMLYYGDGALMHAGMYAVRDTVVDTLKGTAGTVARVEHFGKGLMHNVDDGFSKLEEAVKGLRHDVLLVSAALWKIDRKLFLELGGLSTDYVVAYYEDADFCLRMLERELPIMLDINARWIHLEGGGKAFSPPQRTFMWLNRYLFTERFGQSRYVVGSLDDMELL